MPTAFSTVLYLWSTAHFLLAVHEIGHVLAAWVRGIPAQGLQIGIGPGFTVECRGLPVRFGLVPFLGCADLDLDGRPLRDQLIVLLAGPLASLVAGAGLLAVGLALRAELVMFAGIFSMGIAVTNAMPLPPCFDGWRALKAWRVSQAQWERS